MGEVLLRADLPILGHALCPDGVLWHLCTRADRDNDTHLVRIIQGVFDACTDVPLSEISKPHCSSNDP